MSTLKCTLSEFNQAFVQFHKEIGNKNNSQASIANMHKCLTLMYFGLEDVTEEEVERCAVTLQVATHGAVYRGWDLIEPDLSGEDDS